MSFSVTLEYSRLLYVTVSLLSDVDFRPVCEYMVCFFLSYCSIECVLSRRTRRTFAHVYTNKSWTANILAYFGHFSRVWTTSRSHALAKTYLASMFWFCIPPFEHKDVNIPSFQSVWAQLFQAGKGKDCGAARWVGRNAWHLRSQKPTIRNRPFRPGLNHAFMEILGIDYDWVNTLLGFRSQILNRSEFDFPCNQVWDPVTASLTNGGGRLSFLTYPVSLSHRPMRDQVLDFVGDLQRNHYLFCVRSHPLYPLLAVPISGCWLFPGSTWGWSSTEL